MNVTDRDRYRAQLVGLLLVVLFLLVVTATGCATTQPVEVVEVRVPVPAPPEPLPVPTAPEWRTPNADPSDWRAYLEALALDLVDAWRWSAELLHVIEAHNQAAAETAPDNQTDAP